MQRSQHRHRRSHVWLVVLMECPLGAMASFMTGLSSLHSAIAVLLEGSAVTLSTVSETNWPHAAFSDPLSNFSQRSLLPQKRTPSGYPTRGLRKVVASERRLFCPGGGGCRGMVCRPDGPITSALFACALFKCAFYFVLITNF